MDQSAAKNGKADQLILHKIRYKIDALKLLTEPQGRIDAYSSLPQHVRQDLQETWGDIVQHGPNPTLRWNTVVTRQQQGSDSVELMNPEYFKLWNSELVFWAPHIFFNVGMP
jgi:hypothetical protein